MRILFIVGALLFLSGNLFASFPVVKEKSVDKEVIVEQVNEQVSGNNTPIINTESEVVLQQENVTYTSPAVAGSYNKWIALVLWFFLGVFAAHRWYARKPTGWNILYIITLGGFGIWAIVDLVNILIDNF